MPRHSLHHLELASLGPKNAMISRASVIVARSSMVTLMIVSLLSVSGCARSPRHQKGGTIAQSLGWSSQLGNPGSAPTPQSPLASPLLGGAQSLTQPENPQGESMQELRETTTTTTPAGDVVTVVKSARTVIGGSQDLADIMKAYAASEYMRRIALALILAVVAFAVRRDWPSLQWVFGLGAVAVAFFGPLAVLAVAGIGAGIIAAYYIVSAKLAALAAPLPRL